jgi:hypothetical protein
MEKLQWFKFSISEWKMGKIQRCTPEAKSSFMELCCLYWINETKLSIEDAIIECDEENYKNLLSKKVIKEVDGFIKIYFLDEQFENALNKSEKAKDAVAKRWAKRNSEVNQSNNESNTFVLQQNNESNTEENRIEEKREEKKNITFNFRSALISFGFNSELVDEWIKVRKNKKLTNSKTAFDKFIKQVELNGNDINLILEKCVEKSWGGFESDWYKNETISQKESKKEVLFVTPEGIEITDKLVLHVYQQTGKV